MTTLAAAVATAANTAAQQAGQLARTDSIVDTLDTGTTNANGAVEVGDTGFTTVLIRWELQNPAFGNSDSSGVASANGLPIQATALATGTAAEYRYVDRDDNVVWSESGAGAVSEPGGGGEVQLTDADTGTAGVQVTAGLAYNLTSAGFTSTLNIT